MTSYALNELTWREVAERLRRDPRLIVPVGALEQHGPHLPLGANTLIAEQVVRAASQATGILHAPSLCYGVTVRGGPWAGTAGMRRKTFHRALNELLGRWEDHGVEEFVVVTAHRYEPHLEAILLSLASHSTTVVFDLHQIDVSDLVDADPREEHGGELETSLVMHLAPHLVRDEEVADYVPDPRTFRKYTRGRMPSPPPGSSGVVGEATRATPAKGEAIFRRWVQVLSATLGHASEGTGDANRG